MGFKTYSQNIKIFQQIYTSKTWLNFLMDDLEEDYKIEKKKD
jgi:hypothetical protein